MSAALRKMLQSDEKRKQLTKALLENDLFTKRDPEEVFELVHETFDYIRTQTSLKINGLGKAEFIQRVISTNAAIQNSKYASIAARLLVK
jgi:nucleoid DNA-binding protein